MRKLFLCVIVVAGSFAIAAGVSAAGDSQVQATERQPASSSSNRSANAAEVPVNWTPLVTSASAIPQLFQGSDNQYNLVYEIVLTNFSAKPVDLKGLEITDGAEGKTVKKLADKELVSVFHQVAGTPGTRIPAGGSGIVWVNLSFADLAEVPERLAHKVVTSGQDLTKKQTTWSYAGPVLTVNRKPPLVISPPLRGGKWVAFGGYCGVVGHRRFLFPIDNALHAAQRYAIDWVRLDAGNYSTKGDPKKSASNLAYGQPVYAVADATVYGTIDRFDEQVPFNLKGNDRFSYPAGNSITLDLGNGLYGMYAHLIPGSIKVKPGDKVKRGDVIAHLGNSGNSTGPHLHFHVTDDPHILGSNGVPYLFDDFNLVGEVPDFGRYFKNDQKGIKQAVGQSKFAGAHKSQLPREGHILEFAAP